MTTNLGNLPLARKKYLDEIDDLALRIQDIPQNCYGRWEWSTKTGRSDYRIGTWKGGFLCSHHHPVIGRSRSITRTIATPCITTRIFVDRKPSDYSVYLEWPGAIHTLSFHSTELICGIYPLVAYSGQGVCLEQQATVRLLLAYQ